MKGKLTGYSSKQGDLPGQPDPRTWSLSEHSALRTLPLADGTEGLRGVEWHTQGHQGRPGHLLFQDTDVILMLSLHQCRAHLSAEPIGTKTVTLCSCWSWRSHPLVFIL